MPSPRPLIRIAGLLAAVAAGISLAYVLARYLGTGVLFWVALAAYTAAILAARLPPKQERMIVWALGAIVVALMASRVPLPWAALVGAVPGGAWFWALGTFSGRH